MCIRDRLNSMMENMIKQRAAWKNKKEAQKKDPNGDDFAQKMIDDTLAYFDEKIQELEDELERTVNSHFAQENASLRSIPGIGPKTATVLISITGGFKNFDTYKHLISYVGLAPRIYESGKSIRGKARICKMGMSRIRQLLYMCAWSAKSNNLACKNLFERLIAKGKPIKLALIAVANKLLRQAFTLVKKKAYYNPSFA